MKSAGLQKLRKEVGKEIDEKRYEHTLGVEFTAAALAMRYGEDIEKARIAGILHDCAKCLGAKKSITLCAKHGVELSEAEMDSPNLLHAKTGAILAEEKYGITDEDIINAVRSHTTGRPNMSLLEKIIFIADYIEPGRNAGGRKTIPHLEEIRRLAFENIDEAVYMALDQTLAHLETTDYVIDPMTERTRLYYKELLGK